jgi:hypothetical protein
MESKESWGEELSQNILSYEKLGGKISRLTFIL